jgi:hypothetical protein
MLIRATAHLSTPLAVSDDWSPALDALVDLLVLQHKAPELCCPHPSIEMVRKSEIVLEKYHPIEFSELGGERFRACSSPHYFLNRENTNRFRKRWDYQEKHLDWGKKKAKFSTSEGHTKSYDLPLYLRNIDQIDWFCRGDRDKLEKYLSRVRYIGKKRSYGYGRIDQWEIAEFNRDWSLMRGESIARPVPLQLLPDHQYEGNTIMKWGWRSPYWLPENQEVCILPKNVCYQQETE